MFVDWTYEKAVAKAASLLDTGQTEVHLMRDVDAPWHIADRIEPGSSIRLGMPTSVRVSGLDECGLRFSWHFDIEGPGANGSSSYQIRKNGLVEVMAKMPAATRAQFAKYLRDCAEKVEERGRELEAAASNQLQAAFFLRQVAEAEKL